MPVFFPDVTKYCQSVPHCKLATNIMSQYSHTRGRSDHDVTKIIVLFTSLDPPNWNRTLAAAQKAKSLGIRIFVTARGVDVVKEDKYRTLSSDGLVWFGEEKDQLKSLHKLIDTGTLCGLLKSPSQVSITSPSTSCTFPVITCLCMTL